ncbi:MAG: DedA family protein [Deferribacteraceae bacterium]|jgi:membrane protein DedA with SNARE-associated domain|nr:DedA family protein [Deferribacteraceae bacterium]
MDYFSDLLAMFVSWVVRVVGKLGYAGIIIMMGLERSFVPFPSEVVIPPAGYLTVHGNMNIALVIVCGIFGSVLGASFNYWLGLRFGRSFLQRYGKYLFLTEERLVYMDKFFAQHGEITTLVGRLIPVVRQYISFPAGLARMNFAKFATYTAIGASVWVVILAMLGRVVGNNIELVKEHLHTILFVLLPAMIVLVTVYIIVKRRKTRMETDETR